MNARSDSRAVGPGLRGKRLVLAGLVACLGVTVVSSVQAGLRDGARPWGDLVAGNLLAWLPWLILALPIVHFSRAIWEPGRRGVFLLVNGAVAGLCSAVYLGYLGLFRTLPRPAGLGSWREELRDVAGEHLIGAMLVALLIAAIGRATRAASAPPPPIGRPLRLPGRGRTRFVEPREIDWVAAEGSYVRLHLGERSELLRRPLSDLAEALRGEGFVRVHRSALVNLERVRKLESIGHGDATLRLASGAKVRLSRTYRREFEAAMSAT